MPIHVGSIRYIEIRTHSNCDHLCLKRIIRSNYAYSKASIIVISKPRTVLKMLLFNLYRHIYRPQHRTLPLKIMR